MARDASPDTGAKVQLVTHDLTASENSVISALTDDVDAAYENAQRLGYEIAPPITTEPWEPRRCRLAPDGNLINVVGHREL